MKRIDAGLHPNLGLSARTPLRKSIVRAIECALLASAAPAWGGPVGEQLVSGQASVSRSGAATLIQQASERAVINWQSFGIGAAESVQFAQPSSSSITLNRVLGQSPTEIFGSLSANGQVFLLNPNGVLFGRDAQVNVGALVASTLSLGDEDFLAGRLRFGEGAASTPGRVINQGQIIANGGYVALIGAQVKNEGRISAGGGVALGAGSRVTVNLHGNQLIGLSVEQGVLDALAQNSGLIQTGGARVVLSAKAMDAIAKSVVNNSGIVEATSIEGPGGAIVIEADIIVQSGTLAASGGQGGSIALEARAIIDSGQAQARGTAGDGGRIDYHASEGIVQTAAARLDASGTAAGGVIRLESANTLFSSATLAANGEQGGMIDLLGQNIALAAASLDASGAQRGGSIRIGGDFHGANPDVMNARSTYVNGATQIRADGGQGSVVLWSEQSTGFYGTVSALGGGAIEISSRGVLTYAGSASAGLGGTLLLDPTNIVIDSAAGPAAFSLTDPHAESGNQFGANLTVLGSTLNGVFTPSGKVAVAVPNDSLAGAGAGAVHLFDANSGALISTLVGTAAGDAVGSGGVTALRNGNYVVASASWDGSRGAATWGNGASGTAGTVSAANSLVGSVPGDAVSSAGVTALSNGNYVVASASWDGSRGAATWGNGASGTAGTVSAVNSLVGSAANDFVGFGGVTALTNGNYVVGSAYWNGGTGAATWGNGATGTSGEVSAANSLVGTSPGDSVSGSGIVALANGNYVVASPSWNSYAGAATWGNGTTGATGEVSGLNSLVGSMPGDFVGGGIVALTNGNYVVGSANWNDYAGAATWGNGAIGTTGAVSLANSLVGSTTGDFVSGGGITALANGNYVVGSVNWNGNAGAVTWGNGADGTTGVVSPANSLVGSASGDMVGSNGVVALANGNYVVASAYWNGYRGAATWGDGVSGVSGAVSLANSLVGSAEFDTVGEGVTALANGNYVVISSSWNNYAGAATWGNGTVGVAGAVSAANSLVGSMDYDFVGLGGVTALANGHYVVASPYWNGLRGAATWGHGASGATGAVSAANSLVGAAEFDAVGNGGVTALSNGHYVVASTNWNSYRGAASWGHGASGVRGEVSAANSLTGAAEFDSLAGSGIVALSNGNYLVLSGNQGMYAGQVLVGTPGDISFAHGAGQTMTFNASALGDTLAAGTAVTLQASNDITVNAAIHAAGAAGGALTLQAGRHITLNASVHTANGDFTAVAGDPGATPAERLAGTPAITLGNGVSVNAGSGLVNLAAVGGNFVNNSQSATPITAGRWLIWSSDPALDSRGAMAYGFTQYSAAYGLSLPAQATGNGFLYSLTPTPTPTPSLVPELVGALASMHAMDAVAVSGAATTSVMAPPSLLSGLVMPSPPDSALAVTGAPDLALAPGLAETGEAPRVFKSAGGLITVVGEGVNLPQRRDGTVIGSLQ